MTYPLSLLVCVFLSCVTTASAMIYIPPLAERVRTAGTIVVGTITLEETQDGWHHGHVTVTRRLKGEAVPGARIPVRWKASAPNNPARPQLADYTFRPKLGVAQIILLFPKKEGEKTDTLNWGSTEPPESENAVKAALGSPRVK